MRDVLDDAATLRAADPRGVVAAFEATGDQLRRAHDAARDAAIPFAGEARSVTFCAMGGSAAAGDLIAAGFGDRVRLPLSTLRGYRVPAGYGEEDVVVCVSYSGDTEETLGAFDAARERGCTVIAVCGGGALADRARESDTPVVEIPADAPVPRAGLGALVGGALGAVVGAGLASGVDEDLEDAATTADALSAEFGPDRPTTDNEAKVIAEWVGDRIPVIWGSEGVSGAAAWRWKTAFNENAELPAFSSMLPELDHHEVVGWNRGKGAGFRLIVLREEGEHERVQARLDATLEAIGDADLEWREVRARGDTPLARGVALCLVGDLASAYHALARGIDPAAMDRLERVKSRLAQAGR